MSVTMHSFCPVLHKSPQVYLKLAGPHEAGQGKDMPFHRHDWWELIYYRKGTVDSIVGQQVFRGEPGVVVPIPPLVVHAERALTAYANFWIQLEAPADYPWPRICFDDEHGMFGHVCGALSREWSAQSHCRGAMIELLVAELDILLQRSLEQTLALPDELLVRKAQRIMQERCSQRIRIADIACELGVSPSFLREVFVTLRNQSPSVYLQSVRVQRALSLLRNSNAPLETVADACGYDSASHLSRHVKRATGQSPGAWRVEAANGAGLSEPNLAAISIHPR